MSLKTWDNGARGEIVKGIIDQNFKLVGRNLSKNVLTLTESERRILPSEYLSEGVFSVDPNGNWYRYKSGKWERFNLEKQEVISFSYDGWYFDSVYKCWAHPISYGGFAFDFPTVEVYMVTENGDIPVVGGYMLTEGGVDGDIIILSDMPFNCKVVIR